MFSVQIITPGSVQAACVIYLNFEVIVPLELSVDTY